MKKTPEIPFNNAAGRVDGPHDFFRTIFAHNPEAMVLTSAQDATILDVNDEWVALTGFSRQEVLGHTAQSLGHWPDQLDALPMILGPLKSGGRVRDIDVTLVMKDQVARVVRMNASLVDLSGEPVMVMTLMDVTPDRLAQEALRAGERVLAQTVEKLSRQIEMFELVLAVASLLVLRDDRPMLRYLVTGSCFLAFVVLASTNMGIESQHALPDSVRIGGTWANNFFAAAGLYALIHIIVSDFAENFALEMDLRKGIARGEFFLVYQPQVTSGGVVFGAEALLRWQHPTLGVVPPDEFIPLAEQSGLILPLGTWVLGAACDQLVDWSKRADMAELTLSVNVSAYQFRRSDFVQQVASVMERTGVSPRRLKLELTESSLVHDMDDIIQKMVELKTLGVGFSLDDFGTGYSSLSYLKRLPLDQLKIDKSFVDDVLTDPNDAAIAHMVIELGQNLGFSVIAEGVETQGQCDFLEQNGCHLFQGYLFSRPIPLPQFTDYCSRHYDVTHD